MNREETAEAIKVMQHYADGGEVEYFNESPFVERCCRTSQLGP